MHNHPEKDFIRKRDIIISLLQMFFLGTTSLFCYQQQGYQYISPLPDAGYVAPQATIFFRLQNDAPQHIINLPSCVSIFGSLSGEHACRPFIAADDRTVICKSERPFSFGETVSVHLKPAFASSAINQAKPFEYTFRISEFLPVSGADNVAEREIAQQTFLAGMRHSISSGYSRILPNGVSVPAHFPDVEVIASNNPSRDRLFLSATGRVNFVMILDNHGYPFWYLSTPYPRYDFKVQPNGLLTMFLQKEEGRPFGSGFIGLDNTFTVVDSFYADYGYNTDYHELRLLENGNYLMIGTREDKVDLAKYFSGGFAEAIVQESAVQEFTKAGELIFLWRAWDHFDIADMEIEDVYMHYLRFPHMNAIDIDEDGHILLSSRHLSEVTKINRQTGAMIWRLGGVHNQFTFINDLLDGFSGQHDIRALGNGRYTLFDNGNLHQPPVSRAIEYILDIEKKTATLVWEFRDIPDKYSSWMGNMQRLTNGNTLINWARQHLPKPVEVNSEGKKTFEMNFVDPFTCYRIFRFDWQGVAQKPYLIAEQYDTNITLLFNKFGDTEIDFFNIYADSSPHPTTLLDTSKLTQKSLSDFTNKQMVYFRVTAVDSRGLESSFSNEESLFVNFMKPGENLLLNHSFSSNKDYWHIAINDDARCNAEVNSAEQFHFDIQKGGTDFFHIQLSQGNLKLAKSRDYLFEFDAWADQDRVIEAYVTKSSDKSSNYGKIGPTALKAKPQHFAYSFRMNAPTDYHGAVLFNVGASDIDVYIDNVSLKQEIESSVTDLTEQIAGDVHSVCLFPNPFNIETVISYRLMNPSRVRIDIFNINGQLVRSLLDETQTASQHRVIWDAANQSGVSQAGGIYFCRLDIKNSKGHFVKVRKMILVK